MFKNLIILILAGYIATGFFKSKSYAAICGLSKIRGQSQIMCSPFVGSLKEVNEALQSSSPNVTTAIFYFKTIPVFYDEDELKQEAIDHIQTFSF